MACGTIKKRQSNMPKNQILSKKGDEIDTRIYRNIVAAFPQCRLVLSLR